MGTWGIVSLAIGSLSLVVGSFVLLTRGTWNRDITRLRPPNDQWVDGRVGSKQWLDERYIRVPPGFVLVDRAKLIHILRNSRYPMMDNGACAIDDATTILKDLEAGAAQAGTQVQLEPGMIQVKLEDAETLTEWFNDFCPPPWITQACERVRTAIVAAYPEKMKEARDAR